MIAIVASILIVDDELANRKVLEAFLRPEGYRTRSVESAEAALSAIAADPPDLILLDVMMPGTDGYQLAAQLKGNPVTSNIPIIMVTAQIDRLARLAGLDAGAELAHSLGLEVIAEGVETVEQLSYLRSHRCDQIQGYYFSKPLIAADLEALLLAKKRLPGASSVSAELPVMAVGK